MNDYTLNPFRCECGHEECNLVFSVRENFHEASNSLTEEERKKIYILHPLCEFISEFKIVNSTDKFVLVKEGK